MKKLGLIFVIAVLCCGFFDVEISNANTSGVAKWELDLGIESSHKRPVKLFIEDKELLTGTDDTKPVIVKGYTLIPARTMFENMGYKVTWVEAEKAVIVKGNDKEIKLVINSDVAMVNQSRHNLDVPAIIIDYNKDGKGKTMIPLRFTAEAIGCAVTWHGDEYKIVVVPPIPLSGNEHLQHNQDGNKHSNTDANSTSTQKPKDKEENPSVTSNVMTEEEEKELAKKLVSPAVDMEIPWNYDKLIPEASDKIIVIDIGHGAHDTGAIGHKGKPDELTEKAANMDAGMKLYGNLVRAGAKVYLIRDTDIYYTLKERSAMANGIGASVFVSVHNNSSTSSKPRGTETIYNTKLNQEGKGEKELYGITSKELAKNVQKEMVETLGTKNRGTKNRPELGVVRMTKMPAIIIEGAFLSNEEDFLLLKQADFGQKYADAAARGIIKTMNEAYKNNSEE